MKTCIVILSLLISASVAGQGGGGSLFSIQQNKPIYFTYDSPEDLLLPQVIPSALELKLVTGSQGLSTYVQMISTRSASLAFLNNRLSLELAFKTSSNAIIHKRESMLSNSPVLLFTQPPDPAQREHTFIYDLKLKPLTNFAPVGSYNFSLVFTVTPE